MIHYSIAKPQGIGRFLSFEARFEMSEKDLLNLQLASWRPGRYELGNFAKNIRNWSVKNEKDEVLSFQKTGKDSWVIEGKGASEAIVRYEYYAGELNAGSSFVDDSMIYFNPVNCFLFNPEKLYEDYLVHLNIPGDWMIASALKQQGGNVLYATDFDELADSPVIASNILQHLTYEARGVMFHIWFQGYYPRDHSELIRDFKIFTERQIDLFGAFPVNEYHFLFHLPPYFIRHGVEHSASTVIAMGPFSEFMGHSLYKDFIGISSHELFHTWNVKSIRPKEMMPYDYTKENFNRLGYVTEGVTTYYGDLIPWQCGLFDDSEFLNILQDALNEHLSNPGRFSMSVAESSWDTWLDGYSSGVYGRKVSIYNEGCLLALICDLMIIAFTNGSKSLDDAMRAMNERFGKIKIGYTQDDYWKILEEVSGESMSSIRFSLAEGVSDYLPWIERSLGTVGVQCQIIPSTKYTERSFGFGLEESGGKAIVSKVTDRSPAALAGLLVGDEIASVNGQSVYKNLQNLFISYDKQPIHLRGIRKGSYSDVRMVADGKVYQHEAILRKMDQPNSQQTKLFNDWKKRSN
jgi:predicted metalloprotease with PDZ domain